MPEPGDVPRLAGQGREGGAQVHRGRGYLALTITTTWTAIG